MILSVHFLAGAAIAAKIQNPVLGLFFAFLSHFLLDLVPHQEYHIYNIKARKWKESFFDFLKVSLDIFIGIFIFLILTKNIFWGAAGGFLAALPDGLIFLSLLFPKIKILDYLRKYHEKIHWFKDAKTGCEKVSFFWRIFSQVLIGAASIIFLQ